MSTPTDKPDLAPTIFKYRVMKAGAIIGQFSNLLLAENTAQDYRGTVLDVSTGKLVYDNGRLLEDAE